jgi:molybdate transport system regulatory protein
METRSKVWIEKDGKLVMSDYRARLLRLIDETGSLSEAAVALRISYRRAWGKLKEMEENLGKKLVETTIGGPKGGGSRLTPEGKRFIEQYERFRVAAEQEIAATFTRICDPDA